jgi:SpoVK/Ycf46/Vps4 family AAA+-type ATPase
MWSGESGGVFRAVYEGQAKITSGIYQPGFDNMGHYLRTIDLKTDGLINLPDTITAKILEEFKNFWTLNSEFKNHGFLHKRGYLLWGPPGGGKTSLVNLLMNHIVEMGGIVLNITRPESVQGCMKMIRDIEPDVPMILLMEDLDALVKDAENVYLSILDGSAQVDKVVFIATTNYPEMLDKRFRDRPSRFDTVCYVGMPRYEQRLFYLKAKEIKDDEAQLWAGATEGFSIAHLRELIVAVKCLKQPFEQVLERLRDMHENKPSSANPPEDEQAGWSGFVPIKKYKLHITHKPSWEKEVAIDD